MSSSEQHGAEGEARLPDEVWEQFQNDSWGKIDATAPKEPSARWYEVSARLAAQDGERDRDRGRDRGRERRRTRGPRLRRPGTRASGAPRVLLVSVIIVGVAVGLSAFFAWLQQHGIFF